jgi:amino acid adenylation domain-containing protein
VDTDLVVVVTDVGDTADRVPLLWTYDSNVLDTSTMRHFLDAYLIHLDGALAAPSTPLGDLPVLGERQRQILTHWSGSQAAGSRESDPADLLVHTAFERQAQRTPMAVAVRDGCGTLTFAELDERAARLAVRLEELGTDPDHMVGVLLPRGVDLAVAELGVLKAGAAYLPLDPDHPSGRLAYMCRDSGTDLVVTAERYLSLASCRTLTLESLAAAPEAAPAAAPEPSARAPRAQPSSLAYTMYTSGSTGQPKGVMIEHAALAGFTAWYRREYGLGPTDRVAMINAPGFDASVIDLWPTLTAGASLHVVDPDTRLSPGRLQAWLLENAITVVFLTTALAEPLLDLAWPGEVTLRSVHTGGEALRRRPPHSLPFRLFLAYGPTEATVCASAGAVEPARGQADPPPDIGRPLPTTAVYLLDRRLRQVPPGARGELYLGGTSLARGYTGDPALTAARFIPDHFSARPGARLYRTGDMARFLPDGRLDFLGRADRQVKLRGNRVEPGEIEAVLCRHPAIAQAHVASRADGPGGGKRLVAYVVARAGHEVPAPAEFRSQLERELPSFMVPTVWVPLGVMPLKASGKIDTSSLPAPRTPARVAHEPPATATERVITGIWCEVLGLREAGVLDNFFDLGGHSMLVYQIRDRLAERTGRSLTITDFFRYPTIRALSRHVDSDGQAADGPVAVGRPDGQTRLEARRARLDGR